MVVTLIINCLNCNVEVKIKPSKFGRTKFCSNECRYEYRRNNPDLYNQKYRSGIDVSCDFCGKTFYRKNSEIKEKNYCCHDCYSKSLIKPNKVRSVTKKTIPLICEFCGESFLVEKHNKGKRKFCSIRCASVSRKGKPTGKKDNSLKEKYKISCTNCNKIFLKAPSLHEKHKHHFCSVECMGEYYRNSKMFCGENSGTWTGGSVKYYGENWHAQRRKARERDGYICQDCGITEDDYGQELSVHHIKLFRLFDNYKEANNLGNLVSICEPCHRKRHTGENHPVKILNKFKTE